MQRTFWPLLSLALLATSACADQPTTSALPSSAAAAPLLGLDSPDRIPGKYVVVFKDHVRDVRGTAAHLAAGPGVRLERVFTHALKGFSAALPEQAVQALRQNPNVAYVEAEYILQLAQNPSVQASPGWALDRIDQRDRDLDGSYRYYETGSGVTIYIVDTGVNTAHPEFAGRIQTIFDGNGGNGDDCHGHGTSVASLAAGATYGVARQAQIKNLKVSSGCTGSVPSGYLISAVDAITARTERPAVVNISIVKQPAAVQSEVGSPSAVDNAVQNSISAGITYVVGAGNDGAPACDVTPARIQAAITVSAVDTSDARPSWANHGSCVDLFAPGVNVPAADRHNSLGGTSVNGTSFASPLVAGIAALYLQVNPTATPAQVSSAITSGATRWHVITGGLNGAPQLMAFSRLVRTRRMTFQAYILERVRTSPTTYLLRGHYLSEGSWNSTGGYFSVDASGTQTDIPSTSMDVTDRNGGALVAGDTVNIANQWSYNVHVASWNLRGDRTTVTDGSDLFTIQVVSRASGAPLPTGTGAIGTGTEVAFRTFNGCYVNYESNFSVSAIGSFGGECYPGYNGDYLVWKVR